MAEPRLILMLMNTTVSDSFSAPYISGSPPVLATDLDGTLIPLDGSEDNESDLRKLAQELKRRNATLIFVTGRHLESVEAAMREFDLPQPDWIICDVGTSMFQRDDSGEFQMVSGWTEYQDQLTARRPLSSVRDLLGSFDGLRIQEEEKQGRFKLSYYVDAAQLEELVSRIRRELDRVDAPYTIIHSIDPFNGDGLIDLLPVSVSKAEALTWWSGHTGTSPQNIVFSGDSGNDLAALTAGYRAIVVGNADRTVARQASDAHLAAGWKNRLYLARNSASSGVLEGCRWFGLADLEYESIQQCGATPLSHNTTQFRVWAPKRKAVDVEIQRTEGATRYALTRADDGFFAATVTPAEPGSDYYYRLDEGPPRPDPVSRFQPEGVHGPSRVVADVSFPWTDQSWTGVRKRDLVIYELHIGTFTGEGTFRAAIERLPELVELGITAIEIMPVAQTPGRWNWGYDGVNIFAVRNSYGEPDDFKALVDACHECGLAVILDVVYNHLGPEGNYLAEFAPYLSRRHKTPWGDAFNYDGCHSRLVRQYVIDNALFWLDAYHLDGLRLDAIHFMRDDSERSILLDLRDAVTSFEESIDRTIHLIAEANVFDPEVLSGGDHNSWDAAWCDCLMHSLYSHCVPTVRLTNREYCGAGDIVEALQHGWLYSHSSHDHHRASENARRELSPARPTPDGHDAALVESFITALQTHDAVGNHPAGQRFHQLTSKACQKSAAALTLLHPSIPLIFMGEESASDAPFPFFADFEDERLRRAVDRGRAREYPAEERSSLPLPSDPQTFRAARLDVHDGDTDMVSWYRKLIALRKTGLKEGWLSADSMTADYDTALDVFRLRYRSTGGAIVIMARLMPAGRPSPAPVTLRIKGHILLSSEPTPRSDSDEVVLSENQAIVVHSPTA